MKSSVYRSRSGFQGDSFEEQDTEPVFTGEDLSRVDDTLLDLEMEHSVSSVQVTGISPPSTDSSFLLLHRILISWPLQDQLINPTLIPHPFSR